MTTTIEKRKRTVTNELAGVKRLLDLYPTGILSMVSDTYDLWRMCTEYLPKLKEQILARNGKLVIRPDSGDPVDIICGDTVDWFEEPKKGEVGYASSRGVIELLWDTFGGKINDYGYKELDPHIGAIYGDSITLDRADQICKRLQAKGFASTNIVFGIGSYTYQYNTRDTFGFAMKATYGEISHPAEGPGGTGFLEPREIFKAPITDSGEKKSKKGLLKVCYDGSMETYIALGKPADGTMKPIICKDQQTSAEEDTGLLETVFLDGKLTKRQTLDEIRERLKINTFVEEKV